MLVLGLDTTTAEGSCALARHGELLEVRVGDPAVAHAARLPAELLALLAWHGATLGDVDVMAVAIGPGSFTGLRIGIATMQGLALVRGVGIAALSVLDALAFAGARHAGRGCRFVGVITDAQRGDVYFAFYELAAEPSPGRVDRQAWALAEPRVGRLSDVQQTWAKTGGSASDWLFVRYPGLALPGEGTALFADAAWMEAPPIAGLLVELGRRAALDGRLIRPHAVQPLYVRRPDAIIARERHGPVPAS